MEKINNQVQDKIMRHLEFLWSSVNEMNSYFYIIEQFLENRNKYNSEMNVSPGFYHYTYNALIIANMSEVSRMYDSNSEINLLNFIENCERNVDTLFAIHEQSGSGVHDKEYIESYIKKESEKLTNLNGILENLKRQRDKIYAHNGTSSSEKKAKIIRESPILLKDMSELITFAKKFINDMNILLTNREKGGSPANIGDWNNTLEKLKK